ncbi:SusD/RagB family nutrient-binding outer membrane lipoprotein [Schleiferiaceae bacterium]|nr:SusD/RagB family nutrient-binding outer membrane lipoprotein [Schleiferiaceae bacterium]MDB3991686.1 SusD/RagB family nutrient-binding outer membrane lipoprotein [Schleiferiaceae bacterium]
MKIKSLAILAVAAVGFTACSDAWLEDYKLDQNRPSDVSMEVLLPSAQAAYGMTQGDVLPRLTSIFMQQMTGTDRQSLAHNRYAQIGEGDFNTPWNNSYAGGLYDLKLIEDKAEAAGASAYVGVAKIMTAMYLGVLTDHFGDIPYTDALQGADNLKATFDSQADIYTTIFTLLSEGKDALAQPSSVTPGGDDLIHGGDLAAWAATADGLRARHLNHLSKTSQYNAANVIAACDDALNAGVYCTIGFEAALNQNPWYQFTVIDRAGYISQFGTMYDMMEASSDPRINLYRSADSLTMPAYGDATSALPIVTPFEIMFVKAEAQLAGSASDARATLEAAIESHMTWLGVDAGDIATYVAALPATTDLELIMNEKYVAMFSSSESWTDWRRTGFPTLSAPADANLSGLPRRMPYPEGEYLYNADNVPMPLTSSPDDKFGVTTTYRLWWDM